MDTKIESISLEVASRLRFSSCPHSIPECVLAEDTPIFNKGTLITPLCDSCVLTAVREVLAKYIVEDK